MPRGHRNSLGCWGEYSNSGIKLHNQQVSCPAWTVCRGCLPADHRARLGARGMDLSWSSFSFGKLIGRPSPSTSAASASQENGKAASSRLDEGVVDQGEKVSYIQMKPWCWTSSRHPSAMINLGCNLLQAPTYRILLMLLCLLIQLCTAPKGIQIRFMTLNGLPKASLCPLCRRTAPVQIDLPHSPHLVSMI